MKCSIIYLIYFLILIFFIIVLKNKLFHNQIFNKRNTKNKIEQFGGGLGKTFAGYYRPIPQYSCENDFIQGHTDRSSYYVNMCEPIQYTPNGIDLYGEKKLLKTKRSLRDDCLIKYGI